MKLRLSIPLALEAAFLAVALATGGPLFYLLAALILVLVLSELAAVLWAAGTLRVSAELSDGTLCRGREAMLLLRVRHQGLIPVAPVRLLLSVPGEGKPREIWLRSQPGRQQSLRMPLTARHVGVFSAGIRSFTVEGLLGLAARTRTPSDSLFEMTVLPQTFDTDPLTLAPGDPGSEIMARATEDLNAPSDVRAYQPGDPMKKIHWKLSLRKNELMVRTFDEPVLQDVLVLMDCSRPPSWGHPQAEADLRDALLETAASVLSDQGKAGHHYRLPLMGNPSLDLDQHMSLAMTLDHLARVDFSAEDRFERVLIMESRRLRKVGCVVVIAARLNYAMVDIMTRIHRMGPNLRLYLVTFVPDDQNVLPLISRLRQSGIEVAYVAPEAD
ncbi:MAG: DUF58 domain-containing protein [Clostridia bacterium]|nr:DUF58 domain-containing protein [Clostridia bacterium]